MAVDVGELVAQTVTWVNAEDAREVLGDIPEAADLHARVVGHRLDIVRTAAGAVLLDRHEEAVRDVRLARGALKVLGVSLEEEQALEEEPDRLLSLDDFRSLLPAKSPIPKRVWNVLARQHGGLVSARRELNRQDLDPKQRAYLEQDVAGLERFDGLFVGERVSLRRFKEIAHLGQLTGPNIGDGGLALIDAIAAMDFEIAEPTAQP